MDETNCKSRTVNYNTVKHKTKTNGLSCSVSLNSQFNHVESTNSLKSSWQNCSKVDINDIIEFHSKPFKLCVMKNLISELDFLNGLRDELYDVIFHEKNNDLYKFQQTDDLKTISRPHCAALRKMLQQELLPWLRSVTNIELTDRIDITCSRYDYSDTLLCHDDELDTRRIAFVLYLVPPWKPEDGGALDMFDMDEKLQPKNVVKSIYPQFNRLVWFEVTEASHHQVAEVLSDDKSRLSVNGWFHSPPQPRPARYIEPRVLLEPYGSFEDELFAEWVNPMYLDPLVQSEIQEKFENDSEIELPQFFQEEKYCAVKEALLSRGVSWQSRGPPNKRHYKSALANESLAPILHECMRLMRSEQFFLTLSNLTGLSLHPMAADSDDEEDSDSASRDDDSDAATCDDLASCSGTSVGNKSRVADCSGDTEPTVTSSSTNDDANDAVTSSRVAGDDAGSSGDADDTVTSSNAGEMEELPCKKRKTDSQSAAEKSRDPRCHVELRQWSHGDYTLVHDTDSHGSEYALDVMLYCCCADWKQEYGGYTSYIAKGEDEELLTVLPAENSLALVYRDKKTLRFVKHINCKVRQSPCQTFFDFSGIYFE